jgi:ferredoxin
VATATRLETPGHRPDACLAERFPHVGCRRCAEVCPVAAITIDGAGWQLGEGCLGCGRCVAVCPTDALTRPEELSLNADPGGSGPLVVDCSRVPVAVLPADAIRVPCTGGLRPSDWLSLRAAAGDRSIRIMDRGWCATCPAGGGEHPAADALGRARELCPDGAPELMAAPLPEHRAVAPRPRPRAGPALSRRSFFARLQPAAPAPAPEVDPPRPLKLAPAERLRQHVHLTAAGRPPPAGFFTGVRISERCQNHGVCAGVCPTGALAAIDDDETLGIAFDPVRCIACGQCEARCPEQAIRLDPAGDGVAGRLSAHPARRCRDCGRPFPGSGGEVRCPPCRRSRDLAADGFALMRRPRPGDPGGHSQPIRREASA